MATPLTVTASIFIARPPDAVFDYTQDFSRRREWDSAILEATVVAREPAPRVRIRAKGGLSATLAYRQFHRPVQTSLVMEEIRSAVIGGGGGSWSYAPQDGGTLFTQTNALVLRAGGWRNWIAPWLGPMVRRQLQASTERALAAAKRRLEAVR